MDLTRLLSPKSIAIIGGGVWGENVIKHSRNLGYSGDLWPVHPKGKAIDGIKAFQSISELPHSPDAAYVCINRYQSIEAVRALSKIGAGGAVCLASGFSEAAQEDKEGQQLQQELVTASGDMPLIGPNCYGYINYLNRASLWPDQQGNIGRDSGVAIFTQSSNIALNITFLDCGLPLSHIFTVGNQAKLDMAQLAQSILSDERVKAIGLHIEGIKNLRNFERLAQLADEYQKSIIVLKVGKSKAAQQAALSHTASLTGNHAASTALFKRLGFIQSRSLPEFIETLKLSYITGKLDNNRISSMSCSGGEASLMGDLAEDYDIEFPPLSERIHKKLRATLGPMVALANPLDYHTYIWRDEEKLSATFSAMGSGDHAINLLVMDYPRADRCDDADWRITEKALIKAKETTNGHFGIIASFHENLPEDRAEHLIAHNIVPFSGIRGALSAIENMSSWQQPANRELALPLPCPTKQRYEEGDAKAILNAIGLETPHGIRVNLDELKAEITKGMTYPVVLKGEGFAHKTEAGAVILNIQSNEELLAHAEKMATTHYLIETMVENHIAEILVSIRLDIAHGYLLTLGAGGIYTEIWQDTQSLLLPVEKEHVIKSLDELKIAPLLNGYRGKPKIDKELLAQTILTLQDFVLTQRGHIEEIEINPLLVGTDFAIVTDALLIGDLKHEQPHKNKNHRRYFRSHS